MRRIESAWKKSSDKLTLAVTIPANTAATVLVLAKGADFITESGKLLAKAPGAKTDRRNWRRVGKTLAKQRHGHPVSLWVCYNHSRVNRVLPELRQG